MACFRFDFRVAMLICLVRPQVKSQLGPDNIRFTTMPVDCPFHLLELPSLYSCIDVCMSYTDCASITYTKKSYACNLFRSRQGKFQKNNVVNKIYVNMDDTKEMKSNKACYSRPCDTGERCIANRGSYICVKQDRCPSLHLIIGPCGTPLKNMAVSSGDIPEGFGLAGRYWCADNQQANEWFQVMFKSQKIVKEIATSGAKHGESWVKSFAVEYSLDCVNFKYVMNLTKGKQVFEGNTDGRTFKHNVLQYPFKALCVRLLPVTWYSKICLVFNLMGCDA